MIRTLKTMLAAAAIAFAARRPGRRRQGTQLRHHRHREGRRPQADLGALPRRHVEGDGVKVNGFYATDYAGIIEAQRFNKVQIAWYGNKSAIEAVDRANGEVFAQFVDLDGTPGYYSYIITHKDSGITSLDQVLKNGKDYLRHRRPAVDLRHAGADLLRLHHEQPRPEDALQGDALVQPRRQLPRRAQQAGRCRHQQQRDDREDEGEVAREAASRSASSGPRR